MPADPGNPAVLYGGVDDRAAAGHGFHLNQPKTFTAGVTGKPKCRRRLIGAHHFLETSIAHPDRPVCNSQLLCQPSQIRFQRTCSDQHQLARDSCEGFDGIWKPLVVNQAAHAKPEWCAVLALETTGKGQGR